ncbi:MAG: peptidase MA family metallohydrolase [bacterium]
MTLDNKLILFYILLFFIFSSHSKGEEENDKWHKLQQDYIEIRCKEKDINNGKRIMGFAYKKFSNISSDLGFIPKKTIQIIIAPSNITFYQITGNNMPEWSSGAAIPSQGIILLKSPRITNPDVNLEIIIVHELTHIGLYQATGGKNLMKWFDEGFAQYYSGELNMNAKIHMAKRLLTNNFLTLKEIDEVLTFQKSEASLAYQEAHAAVLYLIDVGGLEAVQLVIENIYQTGNMDQALKAALGIGFEEFESEWIAAMKKRYLWLVIFDYRLIISILFIILFFSAYLMKIRNTRKIKQNWEKEDIENSQTDKKNFLD